MKRILLTFFLGCLFMISTHGQLLADSKYILPNGATLVLIPRDYTATVSISVFVKGGILRETEKTSGIGALFARSWLKNSPLQEKTEFVGGAVNASVSNDYLEFSLAVPSDKFNELLPVLKTHFLAPNIQADVVELQKELTLREIEAMKDDPNSLAYSQFSKATYKNHPYSFNVDGEAETVSKMTVADVKSYFTKNIYAADMFIAVAGNFDNDSVAKIKEIFSAIPKGVKFTVNCANSSIVKDEKVEGTDKRIQQAKLFLAYEGAPASSPDYVYGKVLSDLLGGGMSSPYFNELRKEKGYAYSVGVSYPSRLCSSRFTGFIGLQYENVEDAISTMKRLNKGIFDNITDEDLDKSKNHIIGQILYDAESNARQAWYATFYENLGLGYNHLHEYVKVLKKMDKEELKKIKNMFDKTSTVYIYKPE